MSHTLARLAAHHSDYVASVMPMTAIVRLSPWPDSQPLSSILSTCTREALDVSDVGSIFYEGLEPKKGPTCPGHLTLRLCSSLAWPSPQLQEARCATVDGAAQLVQRVVQRHVGQLLQRGSVGWS